MQWNSATYYTKYKVAMFMGYVTTALRGDGAKYLSLFDHEFHDSYPSKSGTVSTTSLHEYTTPS